MDSKDFKTRVPHIEEEKVPLSTGSIGRKQYPRKIGNTYFLFYHDAYPVFTIGPECIVVLSAFREDLCRNEHSGCFAGRILYVLYWTLYCTYALLFGNHTSVPATSLLLPFVHHKPRLESKFPPL